MMSQVQSFELYYEPTMNQQGFMLKKLDPFALHFLDFLDENTLNLPALEVGAAYGIVTLEAHLRGHPMIANDLSENHLKIMQERAQTMGLKPISTMPGSFFDLPIQLNSLSAIYISRVMHFLTGEDIIKALQLFFGWLAPGGKLFAINETPFFGTTAHYYPLYLEKKEQNHPWPGWVDQKDIDIYFDPQKRPFVQSDLHLLDKETCLKCLGHTSFLVENMSYYDRRGFFPEDALSDGRESVGFIARKNRTTDLK